MEEPIPGVILETYISELKKNLGGSLKEVWLFGSQARGDAKTGSDYDVLVVASGDCHALKVPVREAEWTCMEMYDALVASIIYTPEMWEKAKRSPLGNNILREGRLVA